MKIKKLIASLTAAAVVFTTGATALTACDKKSCDHKYMWTELTPATCVTEGEKQGVCGLCGDVITEIIPVNDNHDYGEWQIEAPTEVKDGKATKVCSRDEKHVVEVTLPKITDEGTGYKSATVTTLPSAITEGERTFVYEHAEGDITFTVSIPATGIEGVQSAVEVAATKANLIRKVTGGIYIPGGGTTSPSDFYYEFGDNYTHIYFDGDEIEHWCSLDENGNIYAVRSYKDTIEQDTSASNELINGYGFSIAYAGGRFFYGLESLLAGLYEWGNAAESQDFYETYDRVNGQYVYEFGFGYLNGRYYNEIRMIFTLSPAGAIQTVDFKCDVYGSDAWEYDDETKLVTVTDDPYGVETITATSVLKDSEEGKEIPENPYTSDWTQVKSFDIQYNGKVITDETVLEVKANDLINLTVINVENVGEGVSNLNYDPLSVYLRDEDGKETVLSAVVTADGLSGYVTGNAITLRSHKVGNLTVVVKTQSGRTSRLINLDVSYSVPNPGDLIPSVYEYGDEGYVWHDFVSTGNTVAQAIAEIYVGEALTVRAVTAPDSAYYDTTVTALVKDGDATSEVDKSLYTISGNGSEFTFTPKQTGTYLLGLVSVHNPQAAAAIRVTVIEPPAINTILVGTYSTKIEYPQPDTVTVTFTQISAYEGTVTVKDSNGTETLSYVWNPETALLTTEHKSGAELNYSIELNEKYKPVLVHPIEFGGNETNILQPQNS